MRYPVAIERGDDNHAFGVIVPDLQFFSARDTLDEPFANAQEAIAGWIEHELDQGRDIPQPSSLEDIASLEDYQGWIFGVVEVPIEYLSDKSQRVNITLPVRVLRRLDFLAQKVGQSRSGYIARMVVNHSQ